MFITAPLAKAYDGGIKLKISGESISGSCNFTDAGSNFVCYFSHEEMVLYFMINVFPGSYHSVFGPMTASAYNSRVKATARYSIKVSPWKIGPASINQGTVAEVKYLSVIENRPESQKGKFLLYLFALQNWGKEQFAQLKLNYDDGDRETIAKKLANMQAQFVMDGILVVSDKIKNIVVAVHVEVERKSSGSRRPGSKTSETEYELNPDIPAIDLAAIANADPDILNDVKPFKNLPF